MADLLTLEVLTPQKRVLSLETPWVTLPGTMGEMGVLPEHIPLVTTVDTGILQYEQDGQRKRAAVHYGYAQVQGDRVTVLSEMVELAEQIDRDRAQTAEQRAREKLRELIAQQEDERARLDKYEAKLKRAMVRQRAAE
ncbi:MAG TPA: F0F1 ATP synthase subunit epsilon [bacterium]|nr:F0F1 ATP synthase subunit epsilon [bacterium]